MGNIIIMECSSFIVILKCKNPLQFPILSAKVCIRYMRGFKGIRTGEEEGGIKRLFQTFAETNWLVWYSSDLQSQEVWGRVCVGRRPGPPSWPRWSRPRRPGCSPAWCRCGWYRRHCADMIVLVAPARYTPVNWGANIIVNNTTSPN